MKSCNLDQFSQLLQEDDYRQCGPKSLRTMSTFMTSFATVRLANLAMNATVPRRKWLGPLRYTKSENGYQLLLYKLTLSRTWWLAIILAFEPVLILIATIIKARFHHAAVSDGFGLTSLISGAEGRDLTSLRGASFSGVLSRKVRLAFKVEEGDTDRGAPRVNAYFNSQDTSGDVVRGHLYA